MWLSQVRLLSWLANHFCFFCDDGQELRETYHLTQRTPLQITADSKSRMSQIEIDVSQLEPHRDPTQRSNLTQW